MPKSGATNQARPVEGQPIRSTIISRAMEQRFANLIFERLVPPFQINNMVWFCHDCLRINA
jgi:hypothetical protein